MQDKRPCVYIVSDRSRVLYVGVTSNLGHRIWQHRNKVFEGFTSRYDCTRLVWRQYFETMGEAIAREKQIKRWNRTKKITLIEKENPTWEDFAAEWGKPIELYDWSKEEN